MAKSIREVLSPLLIVSYVCGIRVSEFPAGHSRPWFSFLYNSLLWSIYFFFIWHTVIDYIPHDWEIYKYCIWLNVLTTLLPILIRVYYNKKFKLCMKKLAIVDETLAELGTTTDCRKLNIKTMKIVLGWSLLCLSMNLLDSLWWRDYYNFTATIYFPFLINFCTHISSIDDLIFASTLRYIGLKFDQVNEYLYKLTDDKFVNRKRKIKQACKDIVTRSHQRELPSDLNSEFMIWIVMHLHLELRRISQEINSIFGIEITVKMTSHFFFLVEIVWELFEFFWNSDEDRKIIYIIILLAWFFFYIYRLLLINYTCEIVSAKANITAHFINKVLQPIFNVEIREQIVQFSLQTIQTPLKFYGLGLFQFGFKFLYRYANSILTCLVILIQTSKYNHEFLKNDV